MKMGAAPYRAVNGLFSVGVEAIFIAGGWSQWVDATLAQSPRAGVYEAKFVQGR